MAGTVGQASISCRDRCGPSLRPHTAGSELLSLNAGPTRWRTSCRGIIFATIRDRRGQLILSIRDQETYDYDPAKEAADDVDAPVPDSSLQSTSVHYVSPTEDNQKQSDRMKEIGIFDEVQSEVGQIIVASVNAERVAGLLNPDRVELEKLIAKREGRRLAEAGSDA